MTNIQLSPIEFPNSRDAQVGEGAIHEQEAGTGPHRQPGGYIFQQ